MSNTGTAAGLWDDDDDLAPLADTNLEGGSGTATEGLRDIPNAEEDEETPEEIAAREAGETEEETEEELAERLAAETAAEGVIEAPGVEQFLSQYGISGGQITFESDEDGEPTTKHFNDLSEEEKFNVLNSLAEKGAPSVAEKNNLTEEEIGLLNFVRGSESVEEAVDNLAQQRVADIMALQNSNGSDFESMSDDAVVSKWLRESNPEATEEELSDELRRNKESSFYTKNANAIRSQFVEGQKLDVVRSNEAEETERQADIDEDRVAIATAVADMDHVSGWAIDDESKNNILENLLEVNSDGDSKFMESVFSDPKELFRVAWLAEHAEAKFTAMEKHFKREMANEYQKGKRFSTEGMPSNPIGGVGNTQNHVSAEEDSSAGRVEDVKTLGNLWED